MMFLFCALLFFISIGCFVCSLLGYGGLFCLLGSSVFWLYLLPCLHEFGHALGCKATRTKIGKISLFLIEIENGKIKILKNFSTFKVTFASGKGNAAVYLSGIVCSLLLVIVFVILYLIFHLPCILPPLIVSALVLASNLIGKRSDLSNFIGNLSRGE